MQNQEFVASYLQTSEFEIQNLAGDASTRKYYRIKDNNEKTYILMEYKSEPQAGEDFIKVQNLLFSNKVSVPGILHQSPGFLLLEDLSDETLEEAFFNNNYYEYYKTAIEEIARLHSIPTHSEPTIANRAFDYEKLYWEMDFAVKHLNQLFSTNASSVLKDLSKICKKLDALPRVICHRDYHSRNLMINNQKLYLIDFQDARLGPWQYDIASLLHDSYVSLKDEEVDQLLKYYLEITNVDIEENWQENYQLQLIQRTFKACGSFASLKNIKGSDRYLQYLPKCFNLLNKNSKDYPYFNDYISDLFHKGADL